MPAAISVGTNPQFDGTERTVEAYAIDRVDLDLYGLHVAVDFLAYLRGQEKFDTLDALLERMAEDVDALPGSGGEGGPSAAADPLTAQAHPSGPNRVAA